MKNAILLFFLAFGLIRCENKGIDNWEEEHADSLCADARRVAVEEFNNNDFLIRDSLLEYNADYAEEIFFQKYQMKPTIWHYYNETPCVWPKGGFVRNRLCYRQTIDSLLALRCGPNFYAQVKKTADSLKKLYPERYSRKYITSYPEYVEGNDSLKARANRNFVYPASAVRDSITGEVRIRLHIDTSGQIDGASVIWGVRRDVDSSALASCLKLGKFFPAFRWGCPQPADAWVDIKIAACSTQKKTD